MSGTISEKALSSPSARLAWDEHLLGEVLRGPTLVELDFELDAIGFSIGEIDMKIEALDVGTADDVGDAPVFEW